MNQDHSHNKKIVLFFGAGASASEGAPVTNDLLPEALSKFPDVERVHRVKQFLEDFYLNDCSDYGLIPTFEEILSPIDIALQKQEQFSNKLDNKKLAELRDDLIYCICSILNEKLRNPSKNHSNLIMTLFKERDRWKNYGFISLNYDILLDNALIKLGDTDKDDFIDLDYGISFRNEGMGWRRPRHEKVYLLKLHGSLNWLYCPTCNSIKITPKDKGAMRIFTHSELCDKDYSNQKVLIIPPTFQKLYDNPYLSSIWLQAERMLREASKVIFIGYSMPESDVHIKYLLKKSLFRENSKNPEIIVIDQKGKNENSLVFKRYKRLFGKINYQPIGFENFTEKDMLFYS